MATPRRAPLASLCLLLFFAAAANALHFYLDTNEKRCFIEELPTDTVVEGEYHFFAMWKLCIDIRRIGHYRALEWNEKTQTYEKNEELGIQVEVEV